MFKYQANSRSRLCKAEAVADCRGCEHRKCGPKRGTHLVVTYYMTGIREEGRRYIG